MTAKINELKSEKIINEILKILITNKEKGFEKMLETLKEKEVISSRATLAKYLNQLHKERKIEYRTNPESRRETLYRINSLYFDRTSLYPKVMGAWLAKTFIEEWWAQLDAACKPEIHTIRTGKIDDKTRAQLNTKIIEKAEVLLPDFEKSLGNFILKSLVSQKDTEQIRESVVFCIRFLYHGVKDDPVFLSVYESSVGPVKSGFSLSYNDLEKLFVQKMSENIKFNNLMIELYGIESPQAKFEADVYEELGIPFSKIYNLLAKKKEIP